MGSRFFNTLLLVGLGYYMFGLWGGFFVFMFMLLFNALFPKNDDENNYSDDENNLPEIVVVLTAAVMKADNRVLISELEYVKAYFLKQFGEENSRQLLLKLRSVLKEDINYSPYCANLSRMATYDSKINLLQFLFGIACVDGEMTLGEQQLILNIGQRIGINLLDLSALNNNYIQYLKGGKQSGYSSAYGHGSGYDYRGSKQSNAASLKKDYKLLGVSEKISNEELKKVYRKLAIKYHPDKVIHKGEAYQNMAEEKFQEINNAYDRIKKERGMK